MLFRVLIVFTVGIGIGLAWWQTIHQQQMSFSSLVDEKFPAPLSARFGLVDPEMAPLETKPLVMHGFRLMLSTKELIPEYAGDWISCTNCHFSAGNTFGNEHEGISLVGVTLRYPKQLSDGTSQTLAERINSCFEKSLNGKSLPIDGQEMRSIIAYLKWISSDIPANSTTPWLGLKKLRSDHLPDPKNGAHVYFMNCAMCHGKHGEGQNREEDLSYPPLWGEHSFNKGAGMNDLPKIASFIYHNMPYNEPNLTVEEALDVAAFIISQPRPPYNKEKT